MRSGLQVSLVQDAKSSSLMRNLPGRSPAVAASHIKHWIKGRSWQKVRSRETGFTTSVSMHLLPSFILSKDY